MPTRSPKSDQGPAEPTEYMYRGRRIQIKSDKDQPHLAIDGHEIHVEQTDDGYLSHAFMFKKFATLFDLAEELVKQAGSAAMQDSPPINPPNPQKM